VVVVDQCVVQEISVPIYLAISPAKCQETDASGGSWELQFNFKDYFHAKKE
jgi:hypothetical protein